MIDLELLHHHLDRLMGVNEWADPEGDPLPPGYIFAYRRLKEEIEFMLDFPELAEAVFRKFYPTYKKQNQTK